MKRLFPALLLFLQTSSAVAISFPNETVLFTKPSESPANAVTAEQLRDYLAFIASDELEGRDTPSRGLNTAAQFIATLLSRWNVKPAGEDGTYYQLIGLRQTTVDQFASTADIDNQHFGYGDGFIAQPAAGSVSAPMVYVGHGYRHAAKNINPYKGIDVKGKIVVYSDMMPKGTTFRDFPSAQRGTAWDSPASFAERNGAKGLIVLPSFRTLARWDASKKRSLDRGQMVMEKFATDIEERLPTITASVRMMEAILRGEEMRAEDILSRALAGDPAPSFVLDEGKMASFAVGVKTQQHTTRNVIGMIEGSDTVLKSEYVALGAHYDHVGIGSPVANDSIYNGADDDGSGTVAVLAIAEALARGERPKRSILFAWHTGEEKGLLGSRYFTTYPTVPIAKIVTHLNIDMIGRSKPDGDTHPAREELSGPKEIYVVGSRMMSTELGLLSDGLNRSYLNLAFNYRYDDPADRNRFFFRSDHYNYAIKGIPVIFYFSGVHEDYHQPSDSFDKIDFGKMESVTRTIGATAWEIANRPARLKVDKALPAEFRR